VGVCASLFLSLCDIHIHTHTHLLQTPRCTIIVLIMYTIAVGHKQFREKDCTVGSGNPYLMHRLTFYSQTVIFCLPTKLVKQDLHGL